MEKKYIQSEQGRVYYWIGGNFSENANLTPEPKHTTISGSKIWIGDNESNRPASITVRLVDKETGIAVKETLVTKETDWKYEFTDVLERDSNGKTYEYVVREIVPNGYIVRYDGWTIINELKPETPSPREVIFSKQNLGGQELSGARIQLLKDGIAVREWITNGRESRFVLEAGNYVFREIVAPEGYEISTEIQFTVSDYGEITNIFVQGDNRVIGSYIVMVDNYKPIPGEPERPTPKEPEESIPEEPGKPTPEQPGKPIPQEPHKPIEKPIEPQMPWQPQIPGEPQRPYYGAPKTGDGFAIGMYGSLIALAGGALTFLRVKDKKDEE